MGRRIPGDRMRARKHTRIGHPRERLLAALVAAAFAAPPAWAELPTGPNVTAGAASVQNTSPRSQTITQATDKAVIDWRSFSIGADHSVLFRQPASSSVVLNRVVGDAAGIARSNILGTLTANGQVFLVNPSGIYFGRGAVLDTAGLVASTLNISNENFLRGNYLFERSPGAPVGAQVVNEGTLRAAPGGYVVLAGDRVVNAVGGLIEAKLGTVALASGERLTLELQGDRLVSFAVNAATADRMGGVANAGLLAADGGKVVMSAMAARDLAGTVVNNSGIVRATGIEERAGAIVLTGNAGEVRSSGRLDASGERGGTVRIDAGEGTAIVAGEVDATGSVAKGGTVEVLGSRVGVEGGALVDASGASGGGTILVGGDLKGANPAIRNAERAYVGAEAALRADATAAGDGGKIVVWSDDWTRFDGHASAKGGPAGGDGGFIEISGRQSLAMNGTADTTAALGRTGTLLLDPATITITDGASGSGAEDGELDAGTPALDPAGQVLATHSPGANFTISRGKIEAIGAANNINLEATGQITINDMVATGRIDLQTGAGNSFTLRSTTSGGITFVDPTNEIRTQGGAINLRAEGTGTVSNLGLLTSNGGNITVFSGDGGLTVGQQISAGTGTVTLETGEATVANQIMAINAPITAATVRLNAGDNVTQTAAGVINATNLVVRYAGLTQTDSALLNVADNIVTNLAATVTGSGNNPADETANAFRFRNAAGNALAITTVDAVAGITTNTGAIEIQADTVSVAQPVNAAAAPAGGSVTFRPTTAARPINLGMEAGGGSLNLTQGELDQITGSLVRIGHATAGSITLSAGITAPAGWNSLSLKTGGSVSQTAGALNVANVSVDAAAGGVTLSNASTAAGNVAINASGAISYTYGSGMAGALTVTTVDGVAGITSNNNDITLTAGGGIAMGGVGGSINAGTGTISLTAASGGVNQAGGTVTGGALLLQGAGNFDLAQANDVNTLAAAVSGNVSFTDADDLAVGSVSGINGITSSGGNVTLRSDVIEIAQNIATGGGGVTLTTTSAATAIDLGGAGAVNFELSAAELNRVIAGGGALQIGDDNHTGAITVSAPVAPGSVTGGISLINRTGGIAVNSTLSSGGGNSPVSLVADGNAGVAGAITSAGGASGVAGSSLTTRSFGGTTLNGTGNSVSSFSAVNASAGGITLTNARAAMTLVNVANSAANGDVTVSNTAGTMDVSGTGVSTAANGNISLSSSGAMTLQQNVTAGGTGDVTLNAAGLTQSGGVLTADQLTLTGSGAFALTSVPQSTAGMTTTFQYNSANSLTAAIAAGSLDYREKDALTVGAVATGGGNLSIVAGGTATQNSSTMAVLTTNAGPLTLTGNLNAGGAVVTLTANNSGGAGINQTGGAITGGTLLAQSGGQALLAQAGNDVGTLAIGASGTVNYTDATGFSVGSTGVSSGGGNVTLTANGLVNLTANVNAGGGNVTMTNTGGGFNQTAGSITGNNLLITATGSVSMPQATNNVATLAAFSTAGDFTYTDANALTIGSIGGTNGVQLPNKGNIAITAQAGTLTVNQPVLSGGPCGAPPCIPDATRGNVSLVAFGSTSDLIINAPAQIAGDEVRLSADRNLTYNAGANNIEATTLIVGGINNPYTTELIADNAFCSAAPPGLTEIIWTFSTTAGMLIGQDLVANRVTLRSIDAGASVAFGPGFGVTAQNLLLDALSGTANFNLGGANNDVTTLSHRGTFLAAGGSVNFTDQNSFATGTYPTAAFTPVSGIGQANAFFGFAGAPGNVTLTASGVGGTLTLTEPIRSTATVTLNAPSGASQGGAIVADKLALSGGGTWALGSTSNDVATFAASLANAGGLTYRDANDLTIGTVGATSGISATGPGALTVDIGSAGGALTVLQPLSVSTTVNTAPARLLLSSFADLSLQHNVTVTGGSVASDNAAQFSATSARGGISQSAGTITVTDNGPATPAGNAPHKALVDLRAGNDFLVAGSNISGCNTFFGTGTASCGQVSLAGGASASSAAGSARVDVRGPGGVNAAGAVSVSSQTGPRVVLTGDLENSNGDLVSSRDITTSTVTLTQTSPSDVNALGNDTAGLLISGNSITANGAVTSNSRYGINFTAQNHVTLNQNVSTTSSDGISMSTGATFGTVQTSGAATVSASTLGLQAARDKGIFNLRTSITSLQALAGAR